MKYNIFKKINRNNVILAFAFLILSIMMLTPFIIMVSTSLKTAAEINSPVFKLIPQKLQFVNYTNAMKTGMWGRWILNSVFVTSFVTLVSLLFNSMAGFSFARLNLKYKNFLFFSLMFGLVIPPQVIMIPVFIIMKNIPLIGGNNILGQGGTGLVDTYGGLMINQLAGAFGVFLCRQFYLNFPKALDEAAKIDGCSLWKTYWRIYVPLSMPIFGSLGVLKLTYTWNDYVWPLVVVNSEEMKTVQLALSIFRNETVNWELLMAATTIITVPLIILFLFVQRFFIQGIVTSGIKG